MGTNGCLDVPHARSNDFNELMEDEIHVDGGSKKNSIELFLFSRDVFSECSAVPSAPSSKGSHLPGNRGHSRETWINFAGGRSKPFCTEDLYRTFSP
jgi:hypothetical protein